MVQVLIPTGKYLILQRAPESSNMFKLLQNIQNQDFFPRWTLFLILLCLLPVIVSAQTLNADLGIVSLDVQPSSAPGSPLYATVSVVNYGSEISMSRIVTVYLSSDPEISSSDYPVGKTRISFLRPGETAQRSILVTLPGTIPTGMYYSGAILDLGFALTPDSNAANDLISGGQVQIETSYRRPQEWINNKISDLVLIHSNYERNLRKLGLLTRDSDLDLIADEHSRDMSVRDFFDHVNPDMEDPVDRAARHGYDQSRTLSDGSLLYGVAENIVKIPVETQVYGFGEIVGDDPDQIAQVAVESFMDSPPHKEALLLWAHERIGVGVASDGKYYYITQVFF